MSFSIFIVKCTERIRTHKKENRKAPRSREAFQGFSVCVVVVYIIKIIIIIHDVHRSSFAWYNSSSISTERVRVLPQIAKSIPFLPHLVFFSADGNLLLLLLSYFLPFRNAFDVIRIARSRTIIEITRPDRQTHQIACTWC